MASLLVTPENQIQRLNSILNQVEQLQKLDYKALTTPAKEKSWSIVEVLKHLDIAYGLYRAKLDAVLEKASQLHNEPKAFQVRPWQKMIINMQRPKNGVRKWKIKTMRRFEPVLDNEKLKDTELTAIFIDFFESHLHFKDCILRSRGKDLSNHKITSAIGPIVNFYLPEAFEFLICHLERHLVQIDSILVSLEIKASA